MFTRQVHFLCVQCLVLIAFAGTVARAQHPAGAPAQSASVFVADGLGKGTVPLDGPWQFHLGDDPGWADVSVDDGSGGSTGDGGWKQLTADKPWGAQGHRSYTGYAWYRRHIQVNPAPGGSPDFALLIPAIDDVYEIYWNGQLVGHLGSMPPHLVSYAQLPAQIYDLGPVRGGVLAIRVFKLPLLSNEDGISGGFEGMPVIGGPQAIAAIKGDMDYHWLHSQQFLFGLSSLYGLVFVFSFIAWLRDRSQRVLFWTASYGLLLLLETALFGVRLHYPFNVHESGRLLVFATRELSLWFLLLWLLGLNDVRWIARTVRIVTSVIFVAVALDSTLYFLYPSLIGAFTYQIADGALTCIYIPPLIVPLILAAVALGRRQRLDSARWIVAAFAFLNNMFYAVVNSLSQGDRFTHWTLGARLSEPVFTLNGSPINVQLILRTLLLLSIVYAVIRYSIENSRHQSALEQEFRNARELQQVLIPESLPEIAGFTLTSAYKPALEVGGDFFQIIPLLIPCREGSTLVVLGDVSGKGLKAAMAVSLIVGAIRMAAETISSPAEILAALNRRLDGRLSGGFATAVAILLDSDGGCTIASAGHPAPFLNAREISLTGALPLGLVSSASYEEVRLVLAEHDCLALFTDGLLEARNSAGELYSFERIEMLFAAGPTAAQATEAAVAFGQDDDVTVLTLTRMAGERESGVRRTEPTLA
jgi:hypothetical protein